MHIFLHLTEISVVNLIQAFESRDVVLFELCVCFEVLEVLVYCIGNLRRFEASRRCERWE